MPMHSDQRPSYDGEIFYDDRALEEEKRRRARRRHRKRIARIVVEHWKWIARDALRAVRFRRCYVMVTTLRAFKRNVSDRKLEWRSALMMHHKRLFRQSEECLVHWHRIVSERKSKLEALKEFWRRRKLRKLALSFQGWWEVAECKRASRKRLLRAECYHAFARMSGCFQAWQVRAAELSLKRGMKLVALRHWSSAHQKKAFDGLVVYRGRKALQKMQLLESVGFWEAGLIRKGFTEWREVTSLIRERRCVAVGRMETVKDSVVERAMGHCFEGWHFVTLESRWETEQLQAADAWRDTELCVKAFGRWIGFLIWKWRVSVFGQRLEAISERLRAAMALETWQKFASIVQTERALEIRQDVLLGATFGTWCMYINYRQQKRESSTMAKLHYQQHARYRILVNWQCEAQRSTELRCKWDLAGFHHRKYTLGGVLKTWKRRCKEWLQKNYMLWTAEQVFTAQLLRFAVDQWKRKVRISNLEIMVEEHYLNTLKRTSIGALRMYANHKGLQEEKRRSAVRHWYLGLLARGMEALKQHVSRRKGKLLLMDRMDAHHRLKVLQGAFGTWRDEYCPDMRAFRNRIAKAALFWRMSLLQRVLFGWQQVAGELAEDKRRDEEARGLANFCVALKTIRGWAARCREKRIKRNRLEAKFRGVTEVLSARKLEHVWDVWVELHRIRMVEAANMMEAAARYEWGVQDRGFQAWMIFCQAKHEKNHRSDVACNFRKTSLANKSLKAWKLGTQLIALRRRDDSDAIKHWCLSMLRKSIFGWRLYVEGRKKKALLMSSALALHSQRLQREGASKWMHVATIQRKKRIKHEGQKRATLLAEELALVAPYAQKWKRKALQKRRTVGNLSSGLDFLFPRNFCEHQGGANHREAPIRSPSLKPHFPSMAPPQEENHLPNACTKSVIERPKAKCPAFLRGIVGETTGLHSRKARSAPMKTDLGKPPPKPLSPRRDVLNSKVGKRQDPRKKPAVHSADITLDSENQPPPRLRKCQDSCDWGNGGFPPVSSGIHVGASLEGDSSGGLAKQQGGAGPGCEMVKGNCGSDEMSLEEALERFSHSCYQVSACTAEIDSLREKLDALGGGGEATSAAEVEADSLMLELSELVKQRNALRESQSHYRTMVQRIIHSEHS